MKKIIFCLCIAALAFQACDKVTFPYQPYSSSGGGGAKHVRRVLLEDFTGHRCPNCPDATRKAEKLITDLPTKYGDRLVLLSIHAGASNNVNPFTTGSMYLNDFRTTAGTSTAAFFGITYNPLGMVNRKDFPTLNNAKASTDWATEVAGLIDTAPEADLTITNTYNTGNGNLTCQIKSEFLMAKSGVNYKLVAFLVQDSIIGWQTDFYANPNDQQYYVQMHTLRDNINGSAGSPWGDALVTGGNVAVGDSIVKTYNYTVNSIYKNIPCVAKDCSVIAFIYDDDSASPTYKQVLQVAEKKIM